MIDRKNLLWILAAALVLGVASVLVNIQSAESLEIVTADPRLTAQLTVAYLLNGAVWAILLICAGWAGRSWVSSAILAICTALVALAVHYGLGWAIGFFDKEAVASNLYWFAFGAVLAIPLGLIGHLARYTNIWGSLARLTIPGGLIAEPFALHRFTNLEYLRPADAAASQISGGIEVTLGLLLAIGLVYAWRRTQRNIKKVSPAPTIQPARR
ncbi:hypothetical protein [Schaalia vaccimaxillae]|uniref:hypothetical protein n=1 Tax=Schaalia vaccimaxillae TaxID=183916 RepID=UPI0003B686E3|nr:hypothetical protein [Schaalia vaccimaxillae]